MSSTEYSSDDGLHDSTSTLRKRFTKEEDALIQRLVLQEGITSWQEIGKRVPGRTSRQCRDRYKNYLFKEVVKKPWTTEEDKIILTQYKNYGAHWVKIAQFLEGRSGNNVKNRWHKYLSKHYKKYISMMSPKNAPKIQSPKTPEPEEQHPKFPIYAPPCSPDKITFPEVLTCRPWELILPEDFAPMNVCY